MKIARKALCDVLLHCSSQLSSVGQGSDVRREKVPDTAEPLLGMGEGGRGLKLLEFQRNHLKSKRERLK